MAVIHNNRILKYLLMMVVSLLLVLNFSIGVSASSGYDRQEADACITISERLSVKGGSSTTKLYRSMSQAEYDSVIKIQKFVPYDFAMEDKWFATTQENATKWGDIFYPDGNYRILEVEVDTNSLYKMYYVDYLDNIGSAYCSPLYILEESIRSIKGVK